MFIFRNFPWGIKYFYESHFDEVYVRNGSIPFLDVNIWTINNNFYGELPKHLVAIIVGELITLTESGQQPTFVIIFLKLGHWGWGSWQLFTALLLVNFPLNTLWLAFMNIFFSIFQCTCIVKEDKPLHLTCWKISKYCKNVRNMLAENSSKVSPIQELRQGPHEGGWWWRTLRFEVNHCINNSQLFMVWVSSFWIY